MRACSAKLASTQKTSNSGRVVFVLCPQARTASSKNGFAYDELVSGPTIYTYVNGNPVSFTDPLGLAKDAPWPRPLSGQGTGAVPKWNNPAPQESKPRSDGRPQGAGCGDAKTDPYVPDFFLESCEKHDSCYENQCGKEGCDIQFYRNMDNEHPYYPEALKGLYFGAVYSFGGSAYSSASKK